MQKRLQKITSADVKALQTLSIEIQILHFTLSILQINWQDI